MSEKSEGYPYVEVDDDEFIFGREFTSSYIEIDLPKSTLENRWYEFRNHFRPWLTRALVCSWRGHDRRAAIFCIYCERCRYKLTPLPGETQQVELIYYES